MHLVVAPKKKAIGQDFALVHSDGERDLSYIGVCEMIQGSRTRIVHMALSRPDIRVLWCGTTLTPYRRTKSLLEQGRIANARESIRRE